MPETYVPVLKLAERYNVHPSTIWRKLKTDPTFPKPYSLSPGCTRWRLSEIEAWENSRLNAA